MSSSIWIPRRGRPWIRLSSRGLGIFTQLALTSLVYPGATHKRFEHSLGVMELAGRAYDVITENAHVTEPVRSLLPEVADEDQRRYWRRVLRMAALCHDVGHIPFSHAAEKQVLPEGWSHERLTREIIVSARMQELWSSAIPPLQADYIVKLAIGKKGAPDLQFSAWETMLSEIVVGDALGVDRMDYLLRDSHCAGVAYGRFDHYRLVDTLRILPSQEDDPVPVLGVEAGGLQSAEALLLARYFMFTQVYMHPVRLIYDIHLIDFLKAWLTDGRYSTDLDDHLRRTDNEVWSAILAASRDSSDKNHSLARRIVNRDERFRLVYEPSQQDLTTNVRAGEAVYRAAVEKFGKDHIRHWKQTATEASNNDFPVQRKTDGRAESSLSVSQVLRKLPVVSGEYIFAAPVVVESFSKWLRSEHENVIQPEKETTSP
jgi:uncharacterized protein